MVLDKLWKPNWNCLCSHILFDLLPVKYPVSVHVGVKADYSKWMLFIQYIAACSAEEKSVLQHPWSWF